jgi:4-diphosphocytidyl-2-C-methyl-D-erythritol kinase
MKEEQFVVRKAPAKVNYRLDVLRRRADGYHDLRMVMQRIDLCDEVRVTLSSRPGIRVACGAEHVPDGEGNIAWRAADAILRATGTSAGLDIAIRKEIPVAAGLGGGSSDAAAVLLSINELLGLGLDDEKLMEIGVTIGADVPFFIFRRTALAEGIGEQLAPLDNLPYPWLLLINPRIPVSTAWVYQNLTLTSRADDYKLPKFCGSVDELCAFLSNDLERVTIGRYPVIQEIKEKFRAAGACGVLMSGSGPTVFGVFRDREGAVAAEKLFQGSGWFVRAVRTLANDE